MIFVTSKADRSLIGHNVVTLVAFLIKFYILIYSCHEVMESSEAVRESTYNASWYDFDTTYFGRAYKQGLLIIMIRVQRPCVLTVGKFTPLTYLTFASASRYEFIQIIFMSGQNL